MITTLTAVRLAPTAQGLPGDSLDALGGVPLDFCVHLLLPEGGHVPGVLTARCGHQLPTAVNQHDQPPPGPPCERCRLIFLADFDTRHISYP